MKVTFLLPMKGHSERVPDKNMRLFGKRPLYHLILNELLKSRFLEAVYIDTDSSKISEDLEKNFPDVKIIDRPVELRGDEVSMNRIIGHDLSVISGDYFLQTHSTNPLLRRDTIDSAIEFYFNNIEKYDSVFGVNRIQSRLYTGEGKALNHNPEKLIRTQDLPPLFEENSNLYIFSRSSFKQAGNRRIGTNPFMFEVPRIESLDIDTQADFDMAVFLYDYLYKA